MQASGLCHTDIHAANGDWPVKPTPPFVPGHEGVGTVLAVGAGVASVSVGDTVAVPWLGYACGECEHCLTGWETLCRRQQTPHQRPPALQDCPELCPRPQVLHGRDLGPYPSPSSPR
jgi:D-arabinose 1-dehydrogenase-like Zn-dependent alcohol dehydrogenase